MCNIKLISIAHFCSVGDITVDSSGVFIGTGHASFFGVLENSVGEEFIGNWSTTGTFRNKDLQDLGGGGSISYMGTYKTGDTEFEGVASTDGNTTVDDSSIKTLIGEVKFDGNLTSPSGELFTIGTYFTDGTTQVDENDTDLGGVGFELFNGTSNSGVQVLKDLDLYENGTTFTGSVRTQGSRVVNEDDTVTFNGTVIVNDEVVSTGSSTGPAQPQSPNPLLALLTQGPSIEDFLREFGLIPQ